MSIQLQQSLLFNPLGDDDLSKRSIINGNTTGLFNLNNVKYNWAKSLYTHMIGNFWVPEKVKWLKDDAIQYTRELTESERNTYKWILSFLIFLDSVQTMNLPNLSDYITAPEVNLLLSIQAFQEAIHSQSYATILESVVSPQERDEIYYFWRDDKFLLERITFIGNIYQEFIDNPSMDNFFTALIANFLLESIYFYNGFAFFDTLYDQGKMKATWKMINYIRRDELSHITLFSNILREIKKEFPDVYNEERIISMMKEAVNQEISWSKHIINKWISWMTDENIDGYTKWLANQRLLQLGINPIYSDYVNNPYKHLDRIQDNNSEKVGFFTETVTNYTQSSSLPGDWDF